jgi:K+-transporting ATPase ATPase B chain
MYYLLDKTGTITIGIRKATHFYPAGVDEKHFIKCCVLSSMADETPEGKSIIELAKGIHPKAICPFEPKFIKFTAETRSSGIEFDGTRIRKGAADAIKIYLKKQEMIFPEEIRFSK